MKILEIAENDAGQRLDKFLRKLFPQATRALLYKINRTGKVKISLDGVNFKRQDNEYKLQKGEKIKLFLSDKDYIELSQQETISQVKGDEKFNTDDIVYEDNFLLVVNKSAGVTVHPGDHKTDQISLIQQVHDYLGGKLDSLTFKPSLVHRIDRDTSGIVLIAKKKDILSKLVDDLKEHTKIKKTYYTLVEGIFDTKEGTIDAKIERVEGARSQNKVRVSNDGQKAISHYKVVDEVICDLDGKKQAFSFVEVQIETGRMHQIRVHLSHIGHPILGDNTYGDKGFNYILGKKFGLKRQMLHAWKIEFFHYGLNRVVRLESRLKSDMTDFIKNIGGKPPISKVPQSQKKTQETSISPTPPISLISSREKPSSKKSISQSLPKESIKKEISKKKAFSSQVGSENSSLEKSEKKNLTPRELKKQKSFAMSRAKKRSFTH